MGWGVGWEAESCKWCLFFQTEDGIRAAQESRGLGDVYKRQGFDSSSGAFHFGFANIIRTVQDLALQIAHIDHIIINDPDRTHAGCSQIECRRRAEPPLSLIHI